MKLSGKKVPLFIVNRVIAVTFFLIQTFLSIHAQLQLSPSNPHYFHYKNRPVLLITSAEHYGCLINADFDYRVYFDALHAEGMNTTRVFTGTMVERKHDIGWMQFRNTLAPQPGRFIAPWSRSSTPGYFGGGNKFDLDTWDENYFARLKDLLTQAAKRNIFIELTLFGNQYKDSLWMNSPLYPGNNIQGEGPSGTNSFLLFQTLKDKQLVKRQEAFVSKVVQELNSFDNLYYEICNEPYNEVKDTAAVDDWHRHIVQFIKKAEAGLSKKHLIASNESVVDDPGVSIANYHYVKVRNMPPFDWLYNLNKVLSMDETVGSVIHADVDDVRVEGWDFILRGGGVYNNLSWEYTPAKPQGTDSSRMIRRYLENLQKFMSGFDYIRMAPDNDATLTGQPDAFVRVLSEKGRQYAIYVHHSKQTGIDWIVGYDAIVKKFRDTLAFNIPAGTYIVKYIDPATGSLIGKASSFRHKGGQKLFYTPLFTTDIGLQIIKTKKK